MKKPVCEICGSNSIRKENGKYVCQECGVEYTLDEVKKLLVEVEEDIIEENEEKEDFKKEVKSVFDELLAAFANFKFVKNEEFANVIRNKSVKSMNDIVFDDETKYKKFFEYLGAMIYDYDNFNSTFEEEYVDKVYYLASEIMTYGWHSIKKDYDTARVCLELLNDNLGSYSDGFAGKGTLLLGKYYELGLARCEVNQDRARSFYASALVDGQCAVAGEALKENLRKLNYREQDRATKELRIYYDYLFEEAYEDNNPESAYNLAFALDHGFDAVFDDIDTYRAVRNLYRMAADGGDERAIEWLRNN